MTTLAINRVAFTIFGIDVMWYGVFIATGMILAVLLAMRLYKNRNGDPDDILSVALVCIPLGIIGARLYFIAFTPGMGIDEFFGFRDGGLAIYGGVIGGIIGLAIYCLITKKNILTLFDCIVPGVLIGQCIGRWGNFTNQEAYGNLVTNPKLQFFPYAVYIDNIGQWRQATFFYESILSFIGIFVILLVIRRRWFKGSGLCTYLIWYGLERTLVEGFRNDSLYIPNTSIRVSQLLSIILVVLGIVLIFVFRKLDRNSSSKKKVNKKNNA